VNITPGAIFATLHFSSLLMNGLSDALH